MNSRKNGRIKKYGVCINDKCENYKVIQEIVHGDLECPKCKKKLSPCAPPKKKSNKKPIIIGLALLAVLGAILGGITIFTSDSKEPVETYLPDSIATIDTTKTDSAAAIKTDTVVVRDTVVQHDTIVEKKTTTVIEKSNNIVEKRTATQMQKDVAPKSTNKDFGYATFNGTWPNAVNGRMVFKTSHAIDSRDPKGRIAEPGDYVIGEWADGHLVQGIWYGADNQVKGSILIGK